jgi:hypothetical protein
LGKKAGRNGGAKRIFMANFHSELAKRIGKRLFRRIGCLDVAVAPDMMGIPSQALIDSQRITSRLQSDYPWTASGLRTTGRGRLKSVTSNPSQLSSTLGSTALRCFECVYKIGWFSILPVGLICRHELH